MSSTDLPGQRPYGEEPLAEDEGPGSYWGPYDQEPGTYLVPEGDDADGYLGPGEDADGYLVPAGDDADGYLGPGEDADGTPGLDVEGSYYPYGAEELEGADDGPSAEPRRPRRRSLRQRRLLAGFGIFIVIVIVVGLVGFVRVNDDINPSGPLGQDVTVHIPKGASTPSIAHLLAKAGVVHGADVFEIYLKLESSGPLLAGTYQLATNEPYSKAMAALEAGPLVLEHQLVIPPGFSVAQMAAAMAKLKLGISAPAFTAAARNGQVSSPYLPAGKSNLEGLLFPATYPVRQGETADELVQYMVETFNQYASQLGLASAAAKLGYTPYQVVTVASIVEREAKFDADRGPIASVIYNRLAQGMPIGAQSTLDYAVGIKKGEADDRLANPYNTLVNKGLPPTPIASPGLASLQAALHPPKTDYLFWVEVNPDGKMGFASTNAGFRHLQQECRKAKLC